MCIKHEHIPWQSERNAFRYMNHSSGRKCFDLVYLNTSNLIGLLTSSSVSYVCVRQHSQASTIIYIYIHIIYFILYKN